jgi:pilus assembly protein CpaE
VQKIMNIKVSAICSTEATQAALTMPDLSRSDVIFTVQNGSAQTLANVIRKDQSDVVLLDFPVADESAMEQIELALMKAPGTHLVLVSPDRSVEFLMRAMRAGVREVLPAPLTQQTVQQAIKHAQGKQFINGRHRQFVGQVLAMIPAKGGAGGTFLATNLAYALSLQGKSVAVLDLNLYLGDAAMFLGNGVAVSSVVDLARQTHRMDATLLESSMLKFSDKLHVLAAPESPERVNEVSAESLEKIIETARSNYDFVVLDMSSMLDPLTIRALDMADTIYLTLQLDVPFLRAAKLMVSVFRTLGYASSQLNLVVNRYEKQGDITLDDVEKATLLKVQRTIPNSHMAVRASVNQGVPLLKLAVRDPVAQALQDWAQALAPTPAVHQKGWLRNLLSFSA